MITKVIGMQLAGKELMIFGYLVILQMEYSKNIVFLKSKNNYESYIVFDRSKTERAIGSAHSRLPYLYQLIC